LAFKNIKVHFEFFQSKSTGKQWNWTSLMGPDKKKMLEKFPVSQFIPSTRGKDIEKLWREFYRLYIILRKAYLSDQEIDQFEIDVQNWICMFCRPTQGHINSSTQIPGLYRKEDVTPYMHVFAKHVPQFLRQLKEKRSLFANSFYFKYRKKITIRFVYFLGVLLWAEELMENQ